MKIKHRIPVNRLRQSDPVSDEYQAEVDLHTNRAVVAYERAQRRIAQDEKRLARLARMPQTRSRKRRIAELDALIELRRLDLDKLHRLMVVSAQSAQHRGRRGHRHVPSPGVF